MVTTRILFGRLVSSSQAYDFIEFVRYCSVVKYRRQCNEMSVELHVTNISIMANNKNVREIQKTVNINSEV